MNNPESAFLYPMSHPPAQKKQRGGATPRPHMSTAAESGGPPPLSSSIGAAPPRGGTTAMAEDAIARRRAELRRLQEQRSKVTRGEPAAASAACGAASQATWSIAPPPPPTSHSPAPPMKPAGIGRQYSDLFPTVPKSPSPMVQRETLLEVSAGIPVPLDQPDLPAELPVKATTPGPPRNPPTVAVNRKLEFPSSTMASRSRAKSAPRARPPPPPPPKPMVAEAPPTTSATAARSATTGPMPSSPFSIQFATKTTREDIKKKQAPKTPHMIPSSRTRPVASGLAETTPEPTEKLPTAFTPHPTSAPISPKLSTSSSSKREKINAMREAAGSRGEKDEPPPQQSDGKNEEVPASIPLISMTTQRLEETLEKTEQEKMSALIKVKELQDQILQLQQQTNDVALPPPGTASNLDLEYLFTLSETDGPVAALEWARHQVEELKKNPPSTPAKQQSMVSFANSPMLVLDTPIRRRISTRTLTPHPKLQVSNSLPHAPSNIVQLERQLIDSFREAAQCVPFEYSSTLATYVVRRPYGMVTAPELFSYCSPMSDQDYARRAHVSTLSALEVAVNIHPDKSVMLLFDLAGVRYKISAHQDEDFTMIENVDDMVDRSILGQISYIDEQANELEYSLDEILEEALLVREQYASTMISTALGLDKRPPAVVPAGTAESGSQPAIPKAPSRDVGVETEEKGMTTDVPKTIETNGDKTVAVADKATPPPRAVEDAHSGSSDVLTMFFSWSITSILGLIYFVVIGLPLKIVQAVFIMTVAYFVFNMMYFYVAQDYNEWVIQSSGGSVTVIDLVNFVNTRHEIM